MEIVFGWFADGPTFPETVTASSSAFNSLVCGPLGLINVLSTHFGVGAEQPGSALRIAEFMLAVESADDGSRFYSKSFAVDPWSTAQLLLSMRDELILAGWSGQEVPGVPKTTDFRSLETSRSFLPGPADQTQKVLEALNASVTNPISKLRLISNLDFLPRVWRQIFKRLEETGTTVEMIVAEPQSETGDLSKVQVALCLPATEEIELEGDGSFAILDADDEIQAAEITASWIAATGSSEELVTICGEQNLMLDQACIRQGLPSLGLTASSPHRAILQVLPLAIELSWIPFNPARCLEFLSISGGPLPRFAANALKRALRTQPGLNGPLWIKAWQEIHDSRIEKLAQSSDGSTNEQLSTKVTIELEDWKSWFEGRANRADGLSARTISDVCKRVEAWAVKRASSGLNADLYFLASHHASDLANIVNSFGDRVFGMHQLKGIVETVLNDGLNSLDSHAEAGSVINLSRPGQIWAAADAVLWWEFASSQPPSFRRDYWTPQEIASFNRAGFELDQASRRALRESETWQSPILNAKNELLLVKPRSIGGKASVFHPIWDELKSRISLSSLLKVTQHASGSLHGTSKQIALRDLSLLSFNGKSLPTPLRDWKVTSEIIKAREKESYTSTERLLGCSLAWTLEYPAAINSHWLESLPEGEKLIGDFAHTIISRLFAERADWEPALARQRASELMEELLPQIASSLLLPGRGVALRKAKDTIGSSIEHLIKVLKQSGLTITGTEVTLEAALHGAKFGGEIDLLAETTDGKPVVLDLKWTNSQNFYRKKIIDGNALQLASYSWLISEQPNSSGFSPVAFYMLRQSRLISNDQNIFPNDSIDSARTIDETWKHGHEAYKRILKEVVDGNLTATGLPQILDQNQVATVSLIDPPCEICNFSHFCGKEELK